MLSKTNSVLWVDPKNKTGNYGLLLVVFEVKGHNINLALIKRDTATSTRATPADGFITYALGKDYAFEKHLGIWSYRKSRMHYLLRLREEGKTVYYTMNPYLVAKIQKAEVIDLSKYNGRFVQIRGKN